MPFAATWKDLESVILSDINQGQICDITYMWNEKNDTDELICKAEIENKLMDTKAEGGQNELGDWD